MKDELAIFLNPQPTPRDMVNDLLSYLRDAEVHIESQAIIRDGMNRRTIDFLF
jgi:hypothetical protein